jgi:hypothetical protein
MHKLGRRPDKRFGSLRSLAQCSRAFSKNLDRGQQNDLPAEREKVTD